MGILAGAASFASFLAMVGMTSCSKDDSYRQTNLQVYLTDHPAEFDNVLVNIVSVEAKVDSGRASCKDDRHGDRPERFDPDGKLAPGRLPVAPVATASGPAPA